MHDTGKPSPTNTKPTSPTIPPTQQAARPQSPAAAADPADDEDETDVIGDLMGHYGKWQLLMTVLLSLFQVPNTFHISSSVYQAANKDFWCQRPPQLQQMPVDVWRNLSGSTDNCHRRDGIDWSRLSNETTSQWEVS